MNDALMEAAESLIAGDPAIPAGSRIERIETVRAVGHARELRLRWRWGNVTGTRDASIQPLDADEQREARLWSALNASGVPAPHSVTVVPATADGPFLLVMRPAGHPMAGALHDAAMRWEISALAFTYARALARVHALDWRSIAPWLADPDELPEDLVAEQVEQIISLYEERAAQLIGPPREIAEAAIDWLEEHRPIEVDVCLCHGRYQPASVLLTADEVTGIIDWSDALVTDAAYDLAALPYRLAEMLPREDAELFSQAALGAYLQASPRGLDNLAFYTVSRLLGTLLDAAEADRPEATAEAVAMLMEGMREAGRTPWRAGDTRQ